MQLQHPTLSATLAERHRYELRSHADQVRIARLAQPPRMPRSARTAQWRRLAARMAHL
jgi:hypothetical protein